MRAAHDTTRVGVLGYGSIGSVVATALADDAVPGAILSGVAVTDDRSLGKVQRLDLPDLLHGSDLIVEAAGQPALVSAGATILQHGVDLLVVSMGAMADPAVFEALTMSGPGRLHLCSGAIGGIDMVRAAAAHGAIHRANITTIKKPSGLFQPTMSPAEAVALKAVTEATTIYDGDIETMVQTFPNSTNVAAALALAVGNWDIVTGTVIADPSVELSTHIIELEAEAGSYRFEHRHQPSATNPRSSAMVPWAVIRSLRDLCGSSWRFV